ncbi:A24 family peptidase [Cryptosporangium japonicum]|uniref:Prepilin type IV endopeptidase peptidase domain-containing protein n=1 Tax=Cryptosporangium japonicum TaxID=80872 RepID=A0ABP3EQA1_9ACTN
MEPLLSVLLVAPAAAAAGPWLADLLERTATVATGPVAGEPALARAAAAAVPIVRARSGPVRLAAGSAAVGVCAAALGAVLAWVAEPPVLVGLVFLAGLGLVLAAVDVRAHRLPDALVLPAYPVLAALLAAGGLLGATGTAALVRAAAAGAVAFGVLYLLAVVVPAGFGYGDVKLTGLLGAALGWYGWPELGAGLTYGFVYGGLAATALLVTRRLSRTDRLAFGPFLLAGALTALCTSS